MGTAENKQAVLDFLTATRERDRDRLRALVADDMIWQVPRSGAERMGHTFPMIGGEQFVEIQQAALDMFYRPGSQTITVDHLVAEDDLVVAFVTMQMLTKAGAPYENEYVFLFRFQGDKIAEHWERTDTAYAFERFDATVENA
jgi:ketosteroid isomerase-like protein